MKRCKQLSLLPLDEGKAAALILQDNRMTTSPHLPWPLMNQRYLQAELLRVQRRVEAQFPPPEVSPPLSPQVPGGPEGALTEAEQAAHLAALWDPLSDQPPPALESLCAQLGLSRFERDLLLLCAGVQLSRSFYALCARACSSGSRRRWCRRATRSRSGSSSTCRMVPSVTCGSTGCLRPGKARSARRPSSPGIKRC